MDLVADVDAVLLRMVEDRPPAARQLAECGVNQTWRTLRPRIDVLPGQGSREARHRADAEIFRGGDRLADLIDRPFLPGFGIAVDFFRRECVEGGVKGGIDRDELALEMGRQLGDLDAVGAGLTLQIVAVAFGFGGLGEIEQASVPGRDLHALIAAIGGPFGDVVPGVERRLVAGELRQKQRGAFHGFHVPSSRF